MRDVTGDKLLVLSVELGGTNQRIALVELDLRALAASRIVYFSKIACAGPEELLAALSGYKSRPFARVSVASFGPIDLAPGAHFGRLNTTQCEAKKAWDGFNPVAALRELFGKPVTIETDVNSSAVGELLFAGLSPAALDSIAYVTVGTGVGVGVVINGRPVHGLLHPEAGHMLVPLLEEDAAHASSCRFHASCVEGRCSIEYLTKVIGCAQEQLPAHQDHPVFARVEHYLALLCVNIFLLTSPQYIVLGGGVGEKEGLVANVLKEFYQLINGYVDVPKERRDDLIQLTRLNDKNAILGAAALHILQGRSPGGK